MPRTFTDNQNRAIDTDARDICVAAGAGSGKTGVLVERYVRLIQQSRAGILPPEQRAGVEDILVITFTEKATKEMKTRIVADLTRLGLTEERRQVETAYISTIHGFCSRLLQENPFEVGIDPHFTVLEEPHARRLLRQTVENVVAAAYEAEDQETSELVAAIQGLRRFGEEQADPVASLAEATERLLGSLRTAGRRREELERHWQRGLEVTASSSDAFVWLLLSPMLEEIRLCVREFERLAATLLGMARGACDQLLTAARGILSAAPLSETLAASREMFHVLRKLRTRSVGVTEAEMQFAQYLGRMKTACDVMAPLFETDLPDREQAAIVCHRMWRFTASVWRAYSAAKRALGKVDNDDLQAECVRLLEDFPHVRERYRRRLRYLMVDEFQDTNPLQMRLIELLHSKGDGGAPSPVDLSVNGSDAAQSGGAPRNYLFVVGDVQQSIYGFRGAEPSLFRNLERSYREDAAGEHIPLATNFRSRQEILRLITVLFRQIWRNEETPFVPLEAGAPFDPEPEPAIELLLSQDLMRQDYLALEPFALAQRVRHMVETQELRLSNPFDPRRGESVRYRDVAVLLRQLTDIQKYEEAFTRAGVPYFVVGGGRGYYARQEIRDLLNILTVLDTPLNDVALMAALRSPMVGADTDTLYRIVEFANGNSVTDVSVNNSKDAGDLLSKSNGAPLVGNVMAAAEGVEIGPDAEGAGAKAGRKSVIPLYIAMQQILKTDELPDEEAAKVRIFAEAMDSLRAQEDRMPVGHLIERLITRTSYDARLLCRANGRRRLANVRKLLQMANSDPVLGVRGFIRRLRDLERLSDREGDAPTEEEAADVVQFHTIHGAKGLEFPVVILADLSRSLDYPASGLFVSDPHQFALGTRVCGAKDAAYRALDLARQKADREEAERLLYVAMTRARERLILCGNLGRNRGLNWGDRIFLALGVNEMPPQPMVRSLIGGVEARLAPMTHYSHMSLAGGIDGAARMTELDLTRYSERLAEALLAGEALESVPL